MMVLSGSRRCYGAPGPGRPQRLTGAPGRGLPCLPCPPRLGRRLGGEAGASSVELLVFFPLLMLIVLLTVQVALSWYGNEVAIMTAREVAREVRNGGDVASARQDGRDYAHRVGGRALTDVGVSVSVSGQEVVVDVEGEAMTILGGLVPRVHASVTTQQETFREDV